MVEIGLMERSLLCMLAGLSLYLIAAAMNNDKFLHIMGIVMIGSGVFGACVGLASGDACVIRNNHIENSDEDRDTV